jgi:hypothetical protein
VPRRPRRSRRWGSEAASPPTSDLTLPARSGCHRRLQGIQENPGRMKVDRDPRRPVPSALQAEPPRGHGEAVPGTGCRRKDPKRVAGDWVGQWLQHSIPADQPGADRSRDRGGRPQSPLGPARVYRSRERLGRGARSRRSEARRQNALGLRNPVEYPIVVARRTVWPEIAARIRARPAGTKGRRHRRKTNGTNAGRLSKHGAVSPNHRAFPIFNGPATVAMIAVGPL